MKLLSLRFFVGALLALQVFVDQVMTFGPWSMGFSNYWHFGAKNLPVMDYVGLVAASGVSSLLLIAAYFFATSGTQVGRNIFLFCILYFDGGIFTLSLFEREDWLEWQLFVIPAALVLGAVYLHLRQQPARKSLWQTLLLASLLAALLWEAMVQWPVLNLILILPACGCLFLQQPSGVDKRLGKFLGCLLAYFLWVGSFMCSTFGTLLRG